MTVIREVNLLELVFWKGAPFSKPVWFYYKQIDFFFFAGRGYYKLDLYKHILSTEKKMDKDTDVSFPKSSSSVSSVEASVPRAVGNQTRTGSTGS